MDTYLGGSMAYLSLNGYELPYPKRGVKVIVSTVVNAGRNANGAVVAQKIGRDLYKIDTLEWPWLDSSQWETILGILDQFFINVTFIDPVSNKPKTVKMYCGDRSAEPYWVNEYGHPTHYRNCKVNLIDTGW